MSGIQRVARSRSSEGISPEQQQHNAGTSPNISKISFRSKKLRAVFNRKEDKQKRALDHSGVDGGTAKTVPSSSSICEIGSSIEAISPAAKRRKRTSLSLVKGSSEDEQTVDCLPVSRAFSLFDAGQLAEATQHLKMVDERLRSIINMHEAPKFTKCESAFASLVRSIVYQQLATKAASSIYARLVSLCGEERDITPSTILKLSAGELRRVGISERKASYLHDLAKKFTLDSLSDSAVLLMDDSSLISTLTAVKGIGVWSVHMFMIFALHRPDVLPVGDLAIRKAFQKLYDLKSLPDAATMEQLSSKWRPYRSLGCWYLWQILTKESPTTNS